VSVLVQGGLVAFMLAPFLTRQSHAWLALDGIEKEFYTGFVMFVHTRLTMGMLMLRLANLVHRKSYDWTI
jgi:hypothetical protein